MKNYIKELRNKFNKYKIDGYIVPKNDDYFTEYSKVNRLKIISNFSGSAGLAIILKKKTIFLQMADTQFKVKSKAEKILKFMD